MAVGKKKVLVALSGGVDSSVSIALLQEEGYEVHSAFIKTWTAPWLPCSWRSERRDAMRVAAQLHVPFYTIDLSKEYEQEVVQYMIHEYKEGRTPNPDVMCNKHIKFGAFFDWAVEKNFDFVATGHYAQTKNHNGGTLLLAGIDDIKDQTYFLWTLTQKQLQKTLFPIGKYEKSKVREIAEKKGLVTAKKKDSQGVCFLGKINMKEFLQHYIEPKKGDVLNLEGDVIGHHDGAIFLTLGQRHGFTINKKTPSTAPQYVVQKDIETNTITVASKNQRALAPENTISLKDVNWITKPVQSCTARLRYNQKLFDVSVEMNSLTDCMVTLCEPQNNVPKGQSMVFYKDGVCLGGGVIG